ncbi:MAG: hypothetical protein IPH54_22715 [Rhodoferax sp.]|nr:hypothetical protein [Rhodoferax sp.]
MDGSGYPAKLAGEAINPLAHCGHASNYDELCNLSSPCDALTPHEALSLMFPSCAASLTPKF